MMKKLVLLFAALFVFATFSIAQDTSTTSSASSQSEKPKRAAAFRPTKEQVKEGQQQLITAKLLTGEATGLYSDETRAAIRTYQKNSGLDVNGKFDRPTLEKMGIELTDKQKGIAATPTAGTRSTASSSTADGAKRPAPFRANADQVKAAQKILKTGNMYAGEETGKFDDAFRDGLGKYQEANGLKVTKTLNSETLDKMGIALTDAQKANVKAHADYDAAKKN